MSMVEEFIAHVGVKGMKWGVRKDKGNEGKRATNRKITKLDKKFERNAQTPKTTFTLHNAAAKKANEIDVPRINNKPQYKDKDFSRDSPLRRKYYKEHQNAFIDRVDEAARSMGTNASGTKRYKIVETPTGGWDVVVADVKHTDIGEVEIHVEVEYTEQGHIKRLNPVGSMAHSDVGEFIEHVGVKGMKWGVRKSRSGKSSKTSAKKTVRSPESKEAFRISEKARTKGIRSLTNKELQDFNERMRLQMQFSQLSPKGKLETGMIFVKDLLGLGKTANEAMAFASSPAGKSIKESVEKSFTTK